MIFVRAMSLVLLVLAPGVAVFLAGHAEAARYVALGTLLSFQLGILARPVAPFAFMIPLLYAAGAVTAQFSDGAVALVVAIAAAVGASSSLGLHRGLLAMLAATLIGSFEPAGAGVMLARSGALLAGSLYGLALVFTAARTIVLPSRAVHPQTALSYAMLLAVLALIAWFAARLSGLEYGWWLPLAVAANGEPSLSGSPRLAVAKTAVALVATVPVIAVVLMLATPELRLAAVVACWLLGATAAWHRATLQVFLMTPVTLLLAVGLPPAAGDVAGYLESVALVCTVVFAFTVLSKWVLWTLRPDAGRATA